MGLATVYSRAQIGLAAPLVSVEVHVAGGLPGMSIVGLPEAAVREAKDRVRAALQNSGFTVPPRRITVNLAPADLPKEGGRFDLPIAIGILLATGQLQNQDKIKGMELLGELSLSGELRPITAALIAALACQEQQRQLLLPTQNNDEAALLGDANILLASSLLSVCAYLNEQQPLASPTPSAANNSSHSYPDMDEVRGQAQARRALEVAAAGHHNILLLGPPGTGKSMLASRLPSILPPLLESEALSTAAVASAAGKPINTANWRQRPFRTPHHSASGVALVGGGSTPRPGEISLAHNGVLFLDELPEFDRHALEVLREPLETGHIVISRAARSNEYPADFLLVAAMNPCPAGGCGPGIDCRCTAEQVQRYRGRVSGPLMDRIDIQIEVPPVPVAELTRLKKGETSAFVRKRVAAARELSYQRQSKNNANLSPTEIELHCELTEENQQLLVTAIDKLGLSARAYHRILRVARTIADLAASEAIERSHLSEAIGYRRLERLPAGLR